MAFTIVCGLRLATGSSRSKTWSRTLEKMPPTFEADASDDSMTDGSAESMDGNEEEGTTCELAPPQVALVRAHSCPAL